MRLQTRPAYLALRDEHQARIALSLGISSTNSLILATKLASGFGRFSGWTLTSLIRCTEKFGPECVTGQTVGQTILLNYLLSLVCLACRPIHSWILGKQLFVLLDVPGCIFHRLPFCLAFSFSLRLPSSFWSTTKLPHSIVGEPDCLSY